MSFDHFLNATGLFVVSKMFFLKKATEFCSENDFAGKRLEYLESGEMFCVYRPSTLNSSTVRGYEFSREEIKCLYDNVIDCLFVAKSQSINDPREQMLRLVFNQLPLIRVPIAN